MRDDGSLKPGYTTTEFWTNLVTQALAGLAVVTTLILHRNFVDTSVANALVPSVAAAAAGISQIVYTLSRSKVKATHLTSLASVAVANATPDQQQLNEVRKALEDAAPVVKAVQGLLTPPPPPAAT